MVQEDSSIFKKSKCTVCQCLFFVLCVKELAQLLKRVDAEISNCESSHHDEIEKRRKYKVRFWIAVIRLQICTCMLEKPVALLLFQKVLEFWTSNKVDF